MLRTLAAPELRRYPALMLLPCLLVMGVLVTRAPVRDGGADSVSAHANVVRSPAHRTVSAGPTVAPPIHGFVLPVLTVAAEARSDAPSHVAPRTGHAPTYRSRAPPAFL